MDGGSVFTERLINGANKIENVDDLGVMDLTTGARYDDSVTADYANDGSVYLHVGYINSGFTGAGTTIDEIFLNGDLVLGKLGVENSYLRDETTQKTPNLPIKITSGDTDSTMKFKFGNTSGSYEVIFFRGTTQSVSTTMQLDTNLEFDLTGAVLSQVIAVSAGNTLIVGSKEYNRTLTLSENTGSVSTLFMTTQGSNVVMHSDLIYNGNMVNYIYRGHGSFTIEGDTSINLTTPSSSNIFRFVQMSSGGDAGSPANAVVNGDFTVNSMGSYGETYFYLLAKEGNVLEVNGKTTINSISSLASNTLTMLCNLTKMNQMANFSGDITVNYTKGGELRLFGVADSDDMSTSDLNQSIIVDGNINIKNAGEDSRNVSLVYVNCANDGASVVMNGDILIEKGTTYTSLVKYSGRSVGVRSTVTFNGDITVTDNTANTQLFGVSIRDNSIINFNGKINTLGRTQQTSFGTTAAGAVINFSGSVDNEFDNIGFRGGVVNLKNTNNSSAIKAQTYVGLGGSTIINMFGKNQMNVSLNSTWNVWAPQAGGIASTINLNGSDLEMGTLSFGGGQRLVVIDYGMSNHGMTSDQMLASGITSEMINATGAGENQVFSLGNVVFGSGVSLDDSYILFKNYTVGEDRILSYVQLSEVDLNGRLAYSDSTLEDNIFRIEGYMDSDKYGIDYYLEEFVTMDAYGTQCWEYRIVIPEPSEIAALFGVAALVFALRRRRG